MAHLRAYNLRNLHQQDDIKESYSGVTTRKRAALKGLVNVSNNQQNKGPKVKLLDTVLSLDKENICADIDIVTVDKKGDNEFITIDDIRNEPLTWPLSSELEDKEAVKTLFKKLNERKEAIRTYHVNNIASNVPIWFTPAANDEFMHSEYLPMILDHLMEKEAFYEPLGRNFLDQSCDVSYRHRYTLVDWLVQVHEQMGMSNESLQLAISMADRFIKILKATLKREDLQIIGVICLFIAEKIEEVYAHSLPEFLEEIKVNYDQDKCKLLEEKIVTTLDFKLSIPLPLAFIRHYNIMFKADAKSHLFSRYFCELSMQDYYASGHSANMIGASCVFLAQVICQKKEEGFSDVWDPPMQCASGLLYEDISELTKNLCVIISKQQLPSRYRAIAKKYSSQRYQNIANNATTTIGFKKILQFFKSTSM